MARLTPDINDTKQVLWYKIAWNLYEWALANGATDLNSPGWGENTFSLQKKAAYYSAFAAETS